MSIMLMARVKLAKQAISPMCIPHLSLKRCCVRPGTVLHTKMSADVLKKHHQLQFEEHDGVNGGAPTDMFCPV